MKDPVIRQLAKRIETRVGRQSKPGDPTVEVWLEMEDGKQHTFLATSFPGSREYPLDYKGVAEKFRRFTSRLLTEKRADEIINLILDVDKVKDMAEIGTLMGSASASST